jgi:hypothetical protein
MNVSLFLFDALSVVPMYYVLWLSLSTLLSGLFYREFQCLPPLRIGLFVMGLVIVGVGVGLLCLRSQGKAAQPENTQKLMEK